MVKYRATSGSREPAKAGALDQVPLFVNENRNEFSVSSIPLSLQLVVCINCPVIGQIVAIVLVASQRDFREQ